MVIENLINMIKKPILVNTLHQTVKCTFLSSTYNILQEFTIAWIIEQISTSIKDCNYTECILLSQCNYARNQ